MSSETNSELHTESCCCPSCANAADIDDGHDHDHDHGTDGTGAEPVAQNAGGTSYSTSTATADGLQFYDALLSGTKWNTLDLSFSFPDSMSDYEYSRSGTFEAMNTAQKAAALYSFDLIGQYTNVRFTEFTGSSDRNADIRLAEESSASTAYAYYPSSSASGGDIWFNSTSYNSPSLGNYAFSTIMHEIGHAMGLKHGHESGFLGALPYEYDSNEYSVMTYRSYVGSTGSSYSIASDSGVQTFMTGDIAALQFLYGANFNTQSGNTTYSWDTTTGQMSINGVGQLDANGSKIFRTIWDGNGTDTYDFSNFTTNMAIDLRPGEGTDVEIGGNKFRADLGPNTSSTFNYGYARKHVYNALQYTNDTRSLIENAKGGAGNDIFTGNAANNVLWGNGGNDTFHDSAGSDTYHGGAGTDEVIFGGKFSSYSFKIGASFLEVIGSAIDYVYDTVERLLFSDQAWDYAALSSSVSGGVPDAVSDTFTVQETAASGLSPLGNLLANDTESQQLPITVVQVNGQSAAVGSTVTLASGASVRVLSDGTVSYGQNGKFNHLNQGQTATDSFTYTVSNGSKTDTASVTVTINGVPDPNAAPVARDDTATGSEGAAITGNVLANDSDADGDKLGVTKVNGGGMNATLASGASVTMGADGNFVYAQNGAFEHLETGQTAVDSFSYTIADGKGGTATATVRITIQGTSPISPDAIGDAYSVQENTATGLATIGNVLANDIDTEGLPLSVSAVNGQAAAVGSVITLASGASVRINADGTLGYGQNGKFAALGQGETATDSFTYTVSNGARSDTATVVVTINGVPDPNRLPVAANDSFSVSENVALNGTVLANDSDPDGDALTVTGVNGGGMTANLASGASITMGTNGAFSYVQNGAFDHLKLGESAIDRFTYAISDGKGGTATATASVTVRGTAPLPRAVNDAFAQTESATTGLVQVGNVLSNDSDPDGMALSVSAVNGKTASVGSVVALASGASVKVLADGSVSYSQNGRFAHLETGQTATDSFLYTVTNGGRTETATAVITINGVSDPNARPVARADAYRGAEGATISGRVLDNDSDADGDPLRIAALEGGDLTATLHSGASVTMETDGRFTYWQNGAFDYLQPGQIATDTFIYTVEDGRGGKSTATVTITVDGMMSDLTPRPGDVIGTAGADALRGNLGSQVIFGRAGDDELQAKHGSDILAGGAGNDMLIGDKNNPTIYYFGIEQTNGVVETDTIQTFRTGIDGISLAGGKVASSRVVDGKHLLLTLDGDGDQVLVRWVTNINKLNFLDSVPNRGPSQEGKSLLPSWGDIAGTDGRDDLYGTAAGERLFGLANGDWIYGRAGNDVLVGGGGNDKLFGGAGADTFVFQRDARDGSKNYNAILDWAPGDAIQLVDTFVVASRVQHNGIILELAGDGDELFVKNVFTEDDLLFV